MKTKLVTKTQVEKDKKFQEKITELMQKGYTAKQAKEYLEWINSPGTVSTGPVPNGGEH